MKEIRRRMQMNKKKREKKEEKMLIKEMCVDEEMSVERFMNVNVDHKCDKIYIESERRKL